MGEDAERVEPIETYSRLMLLDALPPCVYYARVPDGVIKIGHSSRLGVRRQQLRGELLAVIPHATRDDERAEHAMFKQHLVRGREWFAPADEIYDRINELRQRLGVDPIAA
jgi:hypothetical protein